MRLLFLISIILCSTFSYAQKINFSNKEEIINFLNKKEYTVGEYGKIAFKYDSYDNNFKALKFKAEFTPSGSDKKAKKIQLETMIFEHDGFYIQSYFRNLNLKTPGAFVSDNYDFPTIYNLFENGEMYYVEKPNISMEEYIKSITTGQFISASKNVLCK
jgi:hypothetical protein